MLLCAAAALLGATVLARNHDLAKHRSTQEYSCPMHPQVKSGAPGDCPICGMALKRVNEPNPGATATAAHNGYIDTAKQRVLAEQVRAPAWLSSDGIVTAVVHKDDLIGLSAEDHAVYFASSAPSVAIDIHLLADPPVPVDPSTSKIRFGVDRRALAFGDGPPDVGRVQIAAHPRALLVVPASAVLYAADGPYVLAASSDGESEPFRKRPVEIGRILESGGAPGGGVGVIVVLSGLTEGERVVAGDTFFLDAERHLQAAEGTSEDTTP